MSTPTVIVVDDEIQVLEDAQQGPMGPPGPPGPPGGTTYYETDIGVSGHVVVTLDANGKVIPADPTNPAHAATILGVTTSATAPGGLVIIQSQGTVSHLGWSWVIDAPVFIGLSGLITQSPPVGAWQKVIGYARSSTSFVLGIQPAIHL